MRKQAELFFTAALFVATVAFGQDGYDILLKGGHVIDPKNGVDARMDVAIRGGRIAVVAANLDASRAAKTIDVTGLYVTPGLVDIHTHLFHT
ncbi:MAG: amidohydrolase/deacetylase family metallohydrolase, partial [Bryobacteraceae bacterium]